MKIRRIEVKDFRKLRHVVVDDLKDGLNVVVGDNEAGKSTLLAAMRACLFERHRVSGLAAANMQPYGQTVRPEIAIDFEIENRSWRLRKVFCQKPEAELSGPGERTTGDAVEDRLAELFGFSPPGKGQSKPEEHQGIHGLLWVEQGRSHQALGVGAGRRTVASALEAEVGQVLGGARGRNLLEAAERRRDALWDRRQKPKGVYKGLQEEVADLDRVQAELQAALAGQHEKVQALAGKADALERHGQENRLGKAEDALDAARAKVGINEGLAAALAALAGQLEQRQRDLELADERLAARTKLSDQVVKAESGERGTATELADADQLLSAAQKEFETADARRALAQSASARADERVRAHQQVLARMQALAELQRLDDQLASARQSDDRRRRHLANAQAITIQGKDLAKLESLQSERDDAIGQLKAASATLEFLASGHRRIEIDGVTHSAELPLQISHDATINLEGFGKVVIHPGGGVALLRERANAASRVFASMLSEIGYADTQAARDAIALRKAELAYAESEGKAIAALAPQGIDALQSLVETKRSTVQRPLSDFAASLTEVSEISLSDTERLALQASSALRDADRSSADNRDARDAALRDRDRLLERVAGARQLLEDSRASLFAARQTKSDADLEGDRLHCTRALGEATTAHADAERAVAAADVEVSRLELLRAERAERSIREDIEQLSREKRDLEVELSTLDRDGLGEKIEEVAGQLQVARSRLARVELEAGAAQLLVETLQQAQRETKDRWLAPVRQRIQPYLRLVQPDADIVLNEETLEIDEFVRKGVGEPFSGLSVGAREQIAVITRIGLAELLLSSGQPATLILDDALVNTDEPRLGRMHLVLQKAAERLQVLIFTCRERDFIHLGAPIRRVS